MRLEGLHRRVLVPGSAMPAGEYVYSKPPPMPSGRFRSGWLDAQIDSDKISHEPNFAGATHARSIRHAAWRLHAGYRGVPSDVSRRGDDAGSAGSEGRKNAYSDGKESRGLRPFPPSPPISPSPASRWRFGIDLRRLTLRSITPSSSRNSTLR